MNDPYKVLEVTRTSSDEVIAAAHKALARKHHPDTNGSTREANEHAAQINAAFDALRTPEARAKTNELLDSMARQVDDRPVSAVPTPPPVQEVAAVGPVNAAVDSFFESLMTGRPESERPFWSFLRAAAGISVVLAQVEIKSSQERAARKLLENHAQAHRRTAAPRRKAARRR